MSVSSIPHAKRARAIAIADRTRATKRATRLRLETAHQLRGLLATQRRYAFDVSRPISGINSNLSFCLTSSDISGTAVQTSGLLVTPGIDEVLINNVRVKGYIELPLYSAPTIIGVRPTIIRQILVWFNKPLLVASSAGTLPDITEVLNNSTAAALPIQDPNNGGRFVILSDRRFDLGQNCVLSVPPYTYLGLGKPKHAFDYTITVNKRIKYVQPPTAAYPGGHYDSDIASGRVSTGLLVLYQLCSVSDAACYYNTQIYTRLNYTA